MNDLPEMPPLSEPAVWIAEWRGDDSDLDNIIAVTERDELDHEHEWTACYTAEQCDQRARTYALQAVEALREDAERYRWLREPANGKAMDIFQTHGLYDAVELDAAIDAARKAL